MEEIFYKFRGCKGKIIEKLCINIIINGNKLVKLTTNLLRISSFRIQNKQRDKGGKIQINFDFSHALHLGSWFINILL